MSRKHPKRQTYHSIDRVKERLGINDRKVAQRLLNEASRYGKSINDIPEGEFKDFLIKKSGTGKRIKIFKGAVFVFCQTSSRCLTCYPIPDEYKETE